MTSIPLKGKYGEGRVALVDDEDVKKVSKYNVWRVSKRGYAEYSHYIKGSGRLHSKVQFVMLHRLIMNAPPKQEVDHINGNKLDNRKENLRFVTHTQNLINRGAQKNNTSGYKGVHYFKIKRWTLKKPWTASITVKNKSIHLGYFATKEEAALAYNQAAIKYFGEFAKLNDILL